MSKRVSCERCHYPLKTCVCEALEPCKNMRKVILLQSKAESKSAKNTGRLLLLGLQNTCIIQSDNEQAMASLKNHCMAAPSRYALFFPSATSTPFELQVSRIAEAKQSAELLDCHFVFIDSTWRKAKRLLLENEWLQQLNHYHFENDIQSKYRIRKTSVSNGISTLEAVAYAIETADSTDTSPLYDLFEKMQSYWPSSQS
ncbi:DTW domain-containing protein [Glaciecola sp. MH2013]|uniref:tRNA-uridine aminocarboxypropyltransferase n=1 Tax=Glaciecola sp. MH2013 TaxID=2785524 RepID=UPI00189C9505|nr:tRNA-uridine aminocarboxypropyltransferase [Glaciecola sp. MH2013]MBF7074523.1 DTW domain-containing protein [Glaciecola sp. MH2013]